MTQGKHGRAHSSVKQKTEKQTKPYYRHELKYYINYIDYLSVRQSLRHLLESDSNADKNGDYIIRSLYFDDLGDSALRKKIAGVDNTGSEYIIFPTM